MVKNQIGDSGAANTVSLGPKNSGPAITNTARDVQYSVGLTRTRAKRTAEAALAKPKIFFAFC